MAKFGQREALRVIRSRAADDELAALVASLYALCNHRSAEPESETLAEPTPLRRRWRHRPPPGWRSKAAS